MIVDLRTYTMVPGRLNAWLKLYETDGYPIHVRHLGKPMGIFTTDVGTLNQVVFFWRFESQADRERRREALEADPDWISYRKKSADAGNVQHQESKIIKATHSRRIEVRAAGASSARGRRSRPSSASASSSLARLLDHRAELRHIVRAGIVGDPLVGRLHQGSERSQIGPA